MDVHVGYIPQQAGHIPVFVLVEHQLEVAPGHGAVGVVVERLPPEGRLIGFGQQLRLVVPESLQDQLPQPPAVAAAGLLHLPVGVDHLVVAGLAALVQQDFCQAIAAGDAAIVFLQLIPLPAGDLRNLPTGQAPFPRRPLLERGHIHQGAIVQLVPLLLMQEEHAHIDPEHLPVHPQEMEIPLRAARAVFIGPLKEVEQDRPVVVAHMVMELPAVPPPLLRAGADQLEILLIDPGDPHLVFVHVVEGRRPQDVVDHGV